MEKDEHGQPLALFPAGLVRNYGKAVDQLIGIARGILCDGELSDAEAVAFRRFVEQFHRSERVFPFDLLKERLDRVFRDGTIDEEERAELREIMRSLGGLTAEATAEAANLSCDFPLDDPAPSIKFSGSEFVVTGRFAFGTRAKVHDAIEGRGGIAHDNVRHSTGYLVIGHFASRDWLHTSYGLKIERAAELRKAGHRLAIVKELHWKEHLGN